MYSWEMSVVVHSRETCTHVILAVFGEYGVELFEELNHLVGSIVQLVEVTIRIDVTEAGSDRLVDKEQVRELCPGAVVVCQSTVRLDSVRTNLHHSTVHGTTARASIEP